MNVRPSSPNIAATAPWRIVAAVLAVLSLLWTPLHAAMAVEMRFPAHESSSHEAAHQGGHHEATSAHPQEPPSQPRAMPRHGCECCAAPAVTLPSPVVLALPPSVPTAPVTPSLPRLRTLETTPVARGPPLPS